MTVLHKGKIDVCGETCPGAGRWTREDGRAAWCEMCGQEAAEFVTQWDDDVVCLECHEDYLNSLDEEED